MPGGKGAAFSEELSDEKRIFEIRSQNQLIFAKTLFQALSFELSIANSNPLLKICLRPLGF